MKATLRALTDVAPCTDAMIVAEADFRRLEEVEETSSKYLGRTWHVSRCKLDQG